MSVELHRTEMLETETQMRLVEKQLEALEDTIDSNDDTNEDSKANEKRTRKYNRLTKERDLQRFLRANFENDNRNCPL